MINVTAAIEHDVGQAFGLGALGDELADSGSRLDIGAGRLAPRTSASSVEAAASVAPFESSMIWA